MTRGHPNWHWKAKLILYTSPVLKALEMDSFSAKSIFWVLMAVLLTLTQYCEAVAPLLGWGFNVLSIKRECITFTHKYWFHVKFIKEQEANVRIAYCTEVTTPCLEPRYEKHRNDGSCIASFILNAEDVKEFNLYFSSVKGDNLRLMRIGLTTFGGNDFLETMDFLDDLNIVTVPAEEVVYTPGEDAIFSVR
ncbi:hypothetical protein PoB_006922400 [Plakobranchus ocellatus]|uniref:Lipocalin/cytosolic fatty-acid binding domain-containing protein n=1 Tax=Plakobranchus ocellatus TaxID=259542 RepID=A0AAV4DF40_9GAST|nr:hypothetical protein PoB_006922400 [Plakobranchus ocellatus]